MASVSVFVDDAVRGTLPGICAKDGVPTSSSLVINDELGDRAGLGVAWLLVLAGPIGWLGLLLISLSRGGRREVLTVQVPMSDPAYERLRRARRAQSIALLTAIVAAPTALVALVTFSSALIQTLAMVSIVAAVVAAVSFVLLDARVRRVKVGVDLDASRRWVTLSGVHPAFVAACQAHEAREPHRT